MPQASQPVAVLADLTYILSVLPSDAHVETVLPIGPHEGFPVIERDYIMRMIDLLAKALARILFLKDSRDFPKAADELAAASRNLLGLDHDLILMMSDTQLMDLVGADEALAASKWYVLGMLLRAEAEIARATGNPDEDLRIKSLSLLTASYGRQEGAVAPAHSGTIEQVAETLHGVSLPNPVCERLFAFYEATGRYDRAENILYELIDQHPKYIDAGMQFYRRLSAREDSALERGNLPREEIHEGIQELNRRRTS